MEVSQLQTKLSDLDSFKSWQDAEHEQQRAMLAAPHNIDLNNRDHLLGRVAFLDIQQQQDETRQVLMREVVATGDELLPLPYQLGLLAALKTVQPRVPAFRPIEMPGIGRGYTFEMPAIDRSEQPVRPATQPLDRAIQIGDEITRIQSLLDSRKPVPVLMVWNHDYIPPRISYKETAIGEIARPSEAFELGPPKLAEVDGVLAVEFVIPTHLKGVEKKEIIQDDEYMSAPGKYQSPNIPTLQKLAGSGRGTGSGVDALYIGKDEVKPRARKAIADRDTYRAQLHRRSQSNRARRSRLRIR